MKEAAIVAGASLLAVFLAGTHQSAQATPVSHTCSVSQGFDFQEGSPGTVGYVTAMEIGIDHLDADWDVTNPGDPTGEPLGVFGVVTDIYWGGEFPDPISIGARVSASNKNTIRDMLDAGDVDRNVNFAFTIFDYDTSKGKHYECFSTASSVLTGLIAGPGGAPRLTVDSDWAIDVPVPKNYQFTIKILPDEVIEQTLEVALSVSDRSARPWGPSPVPEPSTFILAALGILCLVTHGRRR